MERETMKIEEQQAAIAKVCNDLFFKNAHGVWCFMSPDLGLIEWSIKDLNACHEMQKVLTEKQQRDYCFRLLLKLVDGSVTNDLNDHFIFLNATAAQKSEAFLHTFGLWQESPTQPQ